MNWIFELFSPSNTSLAATFLLYTFVIAVGTLLGKVRVAGVSLGVTFVLFVGLLMAHLGYSADMEVVHFVRDFGLILFIFAIGMQVGPSFLSSFKRGGLLLNGLAALIIVIGAGIAVALFFIDGETPMSTLVGVMSGAVTNTPGLGAAQQTLLQTSPDSSILADTMAMAYAAAYPLGVLGIIMSILLLKWLFKVNIQQEIVETDNDESGTEKLPQLFTLEVQNKHIDGFDMQQLRESVKVGFIVSRLQNTDGEVVVPTSKTEIHLGDRLLIVAQANDVERLTTFIGARLEMEWDAKGGEIVSRRILVTKSKYNGVSLAELHLHDMYSLNVTRINRAGLDLLASPKFRMQVGDRITVVGNENDIHHLAARLGNSLKRLHEPNIITLFFGIFLGIVLGSLPIAIPGMSVPVRLGLAGGPLVVAILISRFGYKLHLVTYTSTSASLMLREIGICLFLASVGIASGGDFASIAFSPTGLQWVAWGFAITTLPLLIVGIIARKFLHLNFLTIMGLLGGAMTDPPVLAYTTGMSGHNRPAVAYSTVYPLTMFLRIVASQVLVLII